MPRTVLIVDDEPLKLITLEERLREAGFNVATATDGRKAQALLESGTVDALVTDVRMPGMDGLALLEKVRAASPGMPVLVMTGYGAVEDAVRAMRAGAMDYLVKPVSGEEIALRLTRAFEVAEISAENRRLKSDLDRLGGGRPVVISEKMKAVFASLRRAAETDATIVLTGETGVGKEVCARYVHENSPRKARPFTAVSCAALAAGVIESELFGHERGAFTGANLRREGLFHAAHQGTLFLDDIDDVPLEVQVKLLRVLENGTYSRVGGTERIRSDVRVVAATKHSLAKMAAEGRFRDDLMYRLSVVSVDVPPLRERPEDVPALAEHFLLRSLARMGRPQTRFTPAALEALCGWRWPGNVRELENLIESLVVLHSGHEIDVSHLPPRILESPKSPLFSLHLTGRERVDLDVAISSFEQALLQWALDKSGGNQAQAAQSLGMARTTLQYRLGKRPEGENSAENKPKADG
jgi:two-component system, NtrC family, response regulator